ncbi:efflux RND transporter periplasmic adaptor subunit [Peptoniphilus lacrimalis]|uniref:efflux RND transporter periplasmic adaptor subunit n=1 Tax=Peptoniphilus lacrimalis TaxID=33031 RepID=UPI00254E9D06|nr:efflux RND transporter periplasmic adaptor subunit [Peptoniphilus lacrimalis]MDK7722817.1 efflux RND transporter periplasmic adaptor subunit [Peptoniphilus lacrimalis]MDK7732419.1 efflux RND transporter periplasmic adaptor subunit [Peptoniphilus lacrimalis]
MKKVKNFFRSIGKFLWAHKFLLIILVLALVFLMASMVKGMFLKKKGTEISSNQVIILKKGDVVNSINENGKVVSSTSTDIFAEKESPVSSINVKVGDEVKEGDIIATLDSSAIDEEIAKKKASARANNKTVGAGIAAAKKRLDEAVENRSNGTNAGIVAAKASVEQSLDAYKSAQKTYEDYKNSLEKQYNPEIVGEKNSRENLAYGEKSSQLKYNQLINDFSDNKKKSSDNRVLAEDCNSRIDAIQSRIDDLTRKSTDIGIRMSDVQNEISDIGSKGQSNKQQGSDVNKNEAKKLEDDIKSKRQELNSLTRYQEEIKIELSKLSDELASAKSQKEKYTSEADALDKEIDSQRKNLDQMSIDIEKAHDDLKSDADKSIKASQARDDQLKTYKLAMDTAENSYKAALVSLKSAQTSADNEISMLRDALNSANANSNNLDEVELKYLNEELEKTKIRALKDGTITKIDAKEGEVPKSAIARIETVNKLKIESLIKEYNVKDVKIGTKVIITSDALSDEEFEGRVSFINPTPEDLDPNSQSKDVNYKTEIDISKEDSEKLSPGMSLRVKYILSEEEDTYHVPTTAIFNRDGKDYVLALKKDGNNTYKIANVEVKKGLENDFETAIKGKDLKRDMKVLSNTQGYGEGQIINISEKAENEEENKENLENKNGE